MCGPRGGFAVVGGRFVGYVRPLVPFTAGAAGMRYPVFLAFRGPAALGWASGSVLLGVFFVASGKRVIQSFGLGAVLAVSFALLVVLSVVVVRRRRAARATSTSSERAGPERSAANR